MPLGLTVTVMITLFSPKHYMKSTYEIDNRVKNREYLYISFCKCMYRLCLQKTEKGSFKNVDINLYYYTCIKI